MKLSTIDSAAAQQRYSTVAILLHWAIALALAFQLALGFAMPKNESGFALYQLHKSVGITILLLTLARLAWRLTHRPPPAVERGFNGFLAKAVHVLLYVFMIGAPLTGWAVVSTSRIQVPTMFWGAIPWPHLPLSHAVHEIAEEGHELLAWIGIALFLLHVAGALRHQFLVKDGLLKRMGPRGSAGLAGLLAALVVVVYFGTGMKISSDVVAAGGYGPKAPAAVPSPTATPTVEATPVAEEIEVAEEEEPASPLTWAIQRGGRLGFTVTSGSDTYKGSFSDWSGAIKFDPENPGSADIRMSINLASASIGDETMDGMLVGADFLAASANPTATWRSSSVTQTGPNRFRADGTLSLKGVSKPQSLTFRLSGEGLRRHVEGSASIDRNAFSVGTGETAAGLGGSVALNFAFDATGREP
ncbi:cytochrome b/b6 domain-containing protein [Altererythrobacter sp. Root672]|uniref:cytochrome b/b6 domain-containing protein n=1 Tax=Altererythrobacter sp. Root672 TaxID=1736584 RepID=UPI001F26E96C|nr:cytochrome b/b6 domain-containing protein [Altererythrobacter sp. Root672]